MVIMVQSDVFKKLLIFSTRTVKNPKTLHFCQK